jgi:hypothetical protein
MSVVGADALRRGQVIHCSARASGSGRSRLNSATLRLGRVDTVRVSALSEFAKGRLGPDRQHLFEYFSSSPTATDPSRSEICGKFETTVGAPS